MIQLRIPSLKHLLYAVLALALICAFAEVALRMYDSTTGQVTRKKLYDRGLISKSWFVHHQLKPSQAFSVQNPDTARKNRVVLNSFGLRGREPAVPKPPGIYRILCLGDETTLGLEVAEAETSCAVLQQLLQQQTRIRAKIEVLNGGVPDYCPLLSYLQLKHQLLSLQPDLVILNFHFSDVADDYHVRRHTTVDEAGHALSCLNPDLELPKSMAARTWQEAFLLPEFLKSRGREWYSQQAFPEPGHEISSPAGRYLWLSDRPPDWSVYINQTLSPVRDIADLAHGWHAEFVMAVTPVPWQISAEASNGAGVRERVGIPSGQLLKSRVPYETLAAFCQKHQVAFSDTSHAFTASSQNGQLFLKNSSGLSAQGHALQAEALARFIIEQQLGLWGGDGNPGYEGGVKQAGGVR